ncbi:MAG: preprotein translocase subunit SecG [Phycisphaerales bacterium]|nr:preprotein translocase subunit SecG [Phycisphaerales bacterium]
MSMWFLVLTFLFILSSVILVLVILLQRPQGGGLAQAFGGASGGGTDTAFGGRTGDVLTYLTMGAFAFYLLVAIGLNVMENTVATQGTATEEEVIEPGLLPVDPAAAAPVGAAPGTTIAPATQAVDVPLIAPAAVVAPVETTPAPVPAPIPEPVPEPTPAPAPAGGTP